MAVCQGGKESVCFTFSRVSFSVDLNFGKMGKKANVLHTEWHIYYIWKIVVVFFFSAVKDLLSEDETHCSLIRWIHQAMDEDSISTVVVVLILKEQY